jgi:hypothetical protein
MVKAIARGERQAEPDREVIAAAGRFLGDFQRHLAIICQRTKDAHLLEVELPKLEKAAAAAEAETVVDYGAIDPATCRTLKELAELLERYRESITPDVFGPAKLRAHQARSEVRALQSTRIDVQHRLASTADPAINAEMNELGGQIAKLQGQIETWASLRGLDEAIIQQRALCEELAAGHRSSRWSADRRSVRELYSGAKRELARLQTQLPGAERARAADEKARKEIEKLNAKITKLAESKLVAANANWDD